VKQKLTQLMNEYGRIAIGVYLATMVVSLVGAVVAIQSGFDVEGVAEGAGMLAATWVLYKLMNPLRVVVTLALTPLVARVLRRKSTSTKPGEPGAPAP
jgi:hypothetical protein